MVVYTVEYLFKIFDCFTKLCWFLPYNNLNQHRYRYVPPSCTSVPPQSHRTPLGSHRAPGWTPCVVEQLPSSSLFYIWWRICFNITLSICPTLSLHLLHPHVYSVWLNLYSCPANRFISTIFVDSIHVC